MWNHLCLISFPYSAGKWTDVFGIECSINFLPPRLSISGDFSWRAHDTCQSLFPENWWWCNGVPMGCGMILIDWTFWQNNESTTGEINIPRQWVVVSLIRTAFRPMHRVTAHEMYMYLSGAVSDCFIPLWHITEELIWNYITLLEMQLRCIDNVGISFGTRISECFLTVGHLT
jgi:hypothetical protein